MQKKWTSDIATESYKLFRENASARYAWERDAVRFDDFRYGQHFSKAEEKELLAFRQAPLPISITTAICDTAEALMTASKPVIRVAPIINPFDDNLTAISKSVAQKYNFLIQKDWYNALGDLQYDRVVRDYTNVGHGLFYVTPRNDYGEFSVDIKHISWRYFYPHPYTKDPFYRDMDNCVIAFRISKDAGYRFVKSLDPEVTYEQYEDEYVKGAIAFTDPATQNMRYSPNSLRSAGVLFTTRLMLEEHKVYIGIPTNADLNTRNPESSFRTYTEMTPEVESLVREGRIRIREEKRFYLTEYKSIGNRGYKTVYPISCYNLVPLVYDHRDTPYPYGRIWYLYPLQRALNKFIMIAILNGTLLNATRVIGEENSFVDEEEWDKNFSVPGARLKWKKTGQDSKPPQIIEGKPLSDAWLRMPQYLSYVMEYISGIFGAMMGDSRESPDVFSTVAALQSAGGQKIKRRLAQADASLSIVGRVAGEFYKNYAPLNGYGTLIDENGEMSKPEMYNTLRANPKDPSKIEIDPNTDLSVGFKDVRFTTQGSNGFESGTEAALLTNLATQLKVPQLVPLILKRLNISDVDKIVQSLDMVASQNSTIEQQSKALGELEGKIKVLANQVTQKSFDVSKAQFEAQFDKELNKIKDITKGNGNG